jgi:hypothetical protein
VIVLFVGFGFGFCFWLVLNWDLVGAYQGGGEGEGRREGILALNCVRY